MKYRDTETGELKTIYTKTSDTLPIGTIIEFDGDTVPDGYEEVDDSNNYSTKEQVIGTLLGYPLYRKVIDIGALPNATSNTIAHNIPSVNMIRSNGSFAISNSGYSVPIPNVTASSTTNGQIAINVDRYNIYVTTNSDRSDLTGYIILEYTKTTDVVIISSEEEV